MSELFLNVVGTSISTGVIVLAVLLLRLQLKKAQRWITVFIWSIAAFRLVCPVTVESAVGLIPSFAGTLQVYFKYTEVFGHACFFQGEKILFGEILQLTV